MNQRNALNGPEISKPSSPLNLNHIVLSRQLALTFVIGLLLAFIPLNVCSGGANVPDKNILIIYSNSPDFPVYPFLTTGFMEQIKNLGRLQAEYFLNTLNGTVGIRIQSIMMQ